MMNDETDTPRTDAAAGHAMGIINEGVLFCSRQLERELDESKADLMRTQIEMQLEIDRANAEVERLKTNLRRAIEIGEESNNYLMVWYENTMSERQRKNYVELTKLKLALNTADK